MSYTSLPTPVWSATLPLLPYRIMEKLPVIRKIQE